MPASLARILRDAIQLLASLIIIKIILGTLLKYADYLPPDFNSDFLHGRENHFYGLYQWAFYPHIFSGPLALALGLFLMSNRLRSRFPRAHRYAGRIQALNVLLIVAPSGLWMALYAEHGPLATLGFSLLALATAFTMAKAWQTAVQRQFPAHRRWTTRCFLLLCSAVLVRINGGLGEMFAIQPHWYYAQAAWTTWLIPLALHELTLHKKIRLPLIPPERGRQDQGAAQISLSLTSKN